MRVAPFHTASERRPRVATAPAGQRAPVLEGPPVLVEVDPGAGSPLAAADSGASRAAAASRSPSWVRTRAGRGARPARRCAARAPSGAGRPILGSAPHGAGATDAGGDERREQ